MLLYLDDDDPTRGEYPPERTIVGPRINLGPAYNVLQKEIEADLYMMCADDIFFATAGWGEAAVLEMPKDGIGVVAFDEGSRENGHPIVGRALIEKLGYLASPHFNHSCVDNWIVGIALHLERFKKISKIRIVHEHPKLGFGQRDQTYRDNSEEEKKKDGMKFHRHKDSMLTEAQRVLA